MFVIRANVKHSNSTRTKLLYVGRDVSHGFGDLNPCWCNSGDEDICHFTTPEAAVTWFEVSKRHLLDGVDEITDIVVSELTYVDVQTLTI